MKTLAILLALAASASAQTVVGWNNLGMHCMDDDYSVFSILPPYNTFDCQFINASGQLVTDPAAAGIVVTYQGVADPDGSINLTSVGKSNFWDYSLALFGAAPPPDKGLPFPTGNPGTMMPGPANTPQPMAFNGAWNWFEATGVPTIPTDDAGRLNNYPLMRLTAKTTGGTVLATTDIVLPVSGEMDCRACHGSGSGPAAEPPPASGGWVNEPNVSRDYRLNILRLHDRHLGTQPFDDALAAKGYPPEGLEASVRDHNKPVLCAACHASEALEAPSYPGVKSLSASIHSLHANVIAPDTGMPLNDIANRSACYQCHPGSQTRCLRGAMGAAVAADGSAAMQCQSCHGTMSQVGADTRTGWLDEPNCGSCHTGTATVNRGQLRFTTVFDEVTGAVREPLLTTFSSNPDTPATGFSLYRFSSGHGGLQCGACHGSTHAVFPSLHRNDNLQNIALQGHAGTLGNCTSCHDTMPSTVDGGPHGMHPIDNNWAHDHGDVVGEDGEGGVGVDACRNCHGSTDPNANDRGSPLSRVFADHTISTKYGTLNLRAGRQVSCYDCHNGVNSSNPTTRTKPVVSNASLVVPAGGSASVTLTATGSNPEFRILRQPAHGTVGLVGASATYFPDPGFSGPDSFTFFASDAGGFVDALVPGTVSVTVGDPLTTDTLDRDGDQWPDVVEYSLGLSTDFPNPPLTQAAAFRNLGGTDYWTLSIPRGPVPPDASAIVEFSSDAVHWVPGITFTDTLFLLEVRDPDPATSHPTRLARIRTTR